MYHPKKKAPNKALWSIVAGILFLHLVALAIFGGITLYEAIQPGDPTFDKPPPAERIDPVKIEFKNRFQEKQKQTQRPRQKLQVQTVGNLAMPEIDIQVPNLGNTGDIGRFGDGRFGELGDGAALGIGEVSVEMFKIQARGEKFLFAIDVRPALLQDKKGGIPTYDVIKKDVLRVINDLPSGVLFNVFLFHDHRVEAWKPKLNPATKSNKEDIAEWIAPINTSPDQTGVRESNLEAESWQTPLIAERVNARSWDQDNARIMVTAAMLEQQPDAVFIFSDGLADFGGATYRSDEDSAETQASRLAAVRELGFDSVEAYEKARESIKEEVNKRVAAFKKRENEQRKKKGIPPRVYTGRENSVLKGKIEKKVAEEVDNYVPRIDFQRFRTVIPEREIEGFFERILRTYYDALNDDRPQLNAIVFKGADEEVSEEQEEVIDDYVDFFDGDYRILKGLGAIDSEDFQD